MNGIERAKLIERDNQRLWPQHVKRALAYMRANMAERITLTGLASACGVPERTLLRQFQQFVGLAPLAYLRAGSGSALRRASWQAPRTAMPSPISRCAAGFPISGVSQLSTAGCSARRHPPQGNACACIWQPTAPWRTTMCRASVTAGRPRCLRCSARSHHC